MPRELGFLTIAEAARLIERKQLSPVELASALIARTERLDPQINAYLLLTADRALAQARRAEQEIMAGGYRGPMHGIPFALKDIYSTAGIRTTGHSRLCLDTVPPADATTVRKLYDAGAVLMGKLATHEFAHGGPSFDLPWPPARNPWNREHFTGGSSSGSGAAVAAGFVPAALGSDTGGSIRGPAALCGIVGLKPTYGLVSRHGVYANSYSFDHAGPMTWTVEDCAMVLQAIAGHDPGDPASASHSVPDYRAGLTGDLRGLRIGVVRHLLEDCAVTPEVVAAFEEALAVLRSLGARLGEVRLRPAQDYYDVKITIAESELLAVHETALRIRPGDFGADFLGRVLPAVLINSRDYIQAQRERRRMLSEMAPIYADFDVLVTATAGGPAPRLGTWRTIEFWRQPSLTTPFNVIGGPALAQCIGFTSGGLPLSMQVVGRPFDDMAVLRVAHAYESATRWRARRPQLDPDAEFSTAPPPLPAPQPAAGIDAAIRDRAAIACRAAGLTLTDQQFEMVCAAAPYVIAMTGRLYRDRSWSEEPANIFRLPDTAPGAP
jgi:aspartyl-tRNA(Asn)/glutamyl-tRNA(Gln) amidotransferase subunit A